MHNRRVPDESDTALLYVDRGLVRADQSPPDLQAQRRAHSRSRAARWSRRAFPVVLVLVTVVLLVPGTSGLLWTPVLLVAAGIAVVLLTRAARGAHAVAGLPVPIEITGKVATAMRAMLAMSRGIAAQRAMRRSRPAAEGAVLLRRWSAAADELRAAWLRGDVAAWHEHARTLAAAGERAEQVRADIEGGT
ncbi:hypothetical protein Ae707Ps1_3721c [Pseudonocardia sp. Ae707_Ps1]|nr:hypothetical protein Ae707Ps1_3721c [Pseudonocardia sp. Ae707_Ps1]